MTELADKHCDAKTPALDRAQIQALAKQVPGWEVAADEKSISRKFPHQDFYRTMAFVNAVAWIANVEDHHPDMEVSYAHCSVRYSTHSVSGLSENDFICAAKIDALTA